LICNENGALFWPFGVGELSVATLNAAKDVQYALNRITFSSEGGNSNVQLSAPATGTLQLDDRSGGPGRFNVVNRYTSSTNFERLNIRWSSNEAIIDTEAGSGGGTLRGIKLGSTAASLLGFYGATPVVRPAAVADATDAATAISQLNAVLARLRTLGLIST
jgi:hypothetical protein